MGEQRSRVEERARRREGLLKLLGGRICGVAGLLLGVGGIVAAFLAPSSSLSAGVVGAGLGILGHLLGSRRLGTVAVVLGVAVVFFAAAVITGLIPGIEPPGHDYSG
jgi:hypothetical protein